MAIWDFGERWLMNDWFNRVTDPMHKIIRKLDELINIGNQSLDEQRKYDAESLDMQRQSLALLKKIAPHGKIDIKFGQAENAPAEDVTSKTKHPKEK